MLAGSSGRVDEGRARLLARHGVLAESVRWFGGPGQHAGAWEIPVETFVRRVEALVSGWVPADDPPSFRELYRLSREADPGRVAAAAIAAERVPEVVLVAGGDDRVWPAAAHAEAIAARRARHGLATTVVTDAEAGHRVVLPGEPRVAGGMAMRRGGTEAADRRLGAAAWAAVREVLRLPGVEA
ncbi:hypothetical protein ACFWE7_13665 [Isoptericola sp. NPDC060282]|uniref:hypothetical protein n=1 Tax=Isoptericola sp. NPDC060282 TaxID=3347093 RepID=UPI00365E26BC